MNIILNSKFFSDLEPSELGKTIQAYGYDGVDLCVRPGHPVNLDNVDRALPEAIDVFKDQDLVCPLATAPVDLNDPSSPEARRLYAACEVAGVEFIKIGYWYHREPQDYWQVLADARTGLQGFVELSKSHGVKTLYHTHSGRCVGSNCAGLMHLLDDFDPAHVGAYVDFGHLALDGEDIAMGLSMVQSYLAAIGVKDGYHAPSPESVPPYRPQFAALGEGSVDWNRSLRILVETGFDGPLAVHTEYQFDETIIRQVGYADTKPLGLEEVAQKDLVFLRNILSEIGG